MSEQLPWLEAVEGPSLIDEARFYAKNARHYAGFYGRKALRKVGIPVGLTGLAVAAGIALLPQPTNLTQADAQYALDAKRCQNFVTSIGVMLHSGPSRCATIAKDHAAHPAPGQ